MTFTVTPLMNEEFLVEGTDSRGTDNSMVLHSPAWAAVVYARGLVEATGVFNTAVREMFKTVTDAADKAKANLASLKGEDYNTVTMTEGADAVLGETIALDPDGVLLNILDQGKSDILRWVGDRLVATK